MLKWSLKCLSIYQRSIDPWLHIMAVVTFLTETTEQSVAVRLEVSVCQPGQEVSVPDCLRVQSRGQPVRQLSCLARTSWTDEVARLWGKNPNLRWEHDPHPRRGKTRAHLFAFGFVWRTCRPIGSVSVSAVWKGAHCVSQRAQCAGLFSPPSRSERSGPRMWQAA